MRILILNNLLETADIWRHYLTRKGFDVTISSSFQGARKNIVDSLFDIAIISEDEELGEFLAFTDYASYRQPNMKIIAVTSNRFFSNGAIFNLIPNTQACLSPSTSSEDLSNWIEHSLRASQQTESA